MMMELMYDYLIDNHIATKAEIDLVTSINGYDEQALRDIYYARTGYNYFGQGQGYEEEDELAVLRGDLQ